MSFPTASAVGYLMPSLRDFEQNHRKAKAEGNSSRHAKNLRISSTVLAFRKAIVFANWNYVAVRYLAASRVRDSVALSRKDHEFFTYPNVFFSESQKPHVNLVSDSAQPPHYVVE